MLQFPTPGPAPDIVGVWVDDVDIGAISVDGSFIYQSAIIGENPYIGRYLSHQYGSADVPAISISMCLPKSSQNSCHATKAKADLLKCKVLLQV